MSAKSIAANLELGHRAIVKLQKTSEGFTHDWEVFVQGISGAPIEHYVEKVVFYLHESFNNPRRAIASPPFHVRENGYGGFNLPIEIYFKASDEHHRKTKINYDLFLQSVDSAPIRNTIKEKITFYKPREEFRKLLLLGGAIEETIPEDSKKTSHSSVSRPASGGKTKPRYDSSVSSKSKNDPGDSSTRKSKDVTAKHESNRRKDKTKESSRAKDSLQKQSTKTRESHSRVKEEPTKAKYRDQDAKSTEKNKHAPAKQKDHPKLKKETKVPDAFSELFGEPIRKVNTQTPYLHKNGKSQQKNQQRESSDEQVSTAVVSVKVAKATKKQKGKDSFKITDFCKEQPDKEPNQAPTPKTSKKSQKAKESQAVSKDQGRRDIPKVAQIKSTGQKYNKECIPVKEPAQPQKNSHKQKQGQKKKEYLPEPKKERKIPVTPPTPRKHASQLRRLSSSSEYSSSGSRSRSPSKSSDDSSKSRRRSPSRSLSRQRSLSQSRSSFSEKGHSRSPSARSREELSKSPTASRSHSDSAMSRSSSSSSCHSSLSVGAVQDSASVDKPTTGGSGGPLGVLVQDIEGISTDSDDDKRFGSSGEENLPSQMKKSYSKGRTSEMSSLPSSRHSSCHSGKGASSSSENESVTKKRSDKEKKRRKRLVAKTKRKEERERERAEARIPSTPSAMFDTDKSDIEMVHDQSESFSEQSQRENVELLERCRRLVINEEFDKIQDIMKIVGRNHTIVNGCVAIDYYKLTRITRTRLRNYVDRLDHPQ